VGMETFTIFQWVMVAIVGTLASARLVRLVSFDEYPPTVWMRNKWDQVTLKEDAESVQKYAGWNKLIHCAFCASFYITAVVAIAGLVTSFGVVWWVVCSILAASYVAGMIVASDWG